MKITAVPLRSLTFPGKGEEGIICYPSSIMWAGGSCVSLFLVSLSCISQLVIYSLCKTVENNDFNLFFAAYSFELKL